MVSKKERVVRDLDDESLSLSDSARQISSTQGLEFRYCLNNLHAKRKGFESRNEYQNYREYLKGEDSETSIEEYRQIRREEKLVHEMNSAIKKYFKQSRSKKVRKPRKNQALRKTPILDEMMKFQPSGNFSSLEEKIIDNDNQFWTWEEACTNLAERMGVSPHTVGNHLFAVRKGYSLKEYLNASARLKGFNTYTAYKDNIAKKKGFKSRDEEITYGFYKSSSGKSPSIEEFREIQAREKETKKLIDTLKRRLPPEIRSKKRKNSTIISEMTKFPPLEDQHLSELELITKKLDDPNLNIKDSATQISVKLGANMYTIQRYVTLIRLGYSASEYYEAQARNEGFEDRSEKNKFRHFLKKTDREITIEDFRAKQATDIFDKGYVQEEVPVNLSGNELNPYEILVLKESYTPQIEEVLSTLLPKEQEVIQLRFYQGQTLQEVGNKFNVGGERIRQIETKALRKLRHPSRIKLLKEIDLRI